MFHLNENSLKDSNCDEVLICSREERFESNLHISVIAEYDDGSITKHSLTGTSVTSTNDVSITSYERTCDIFQLQQNGGSTAAILNSAELDDDNVSIISLQTLDGVCDLQGSGEQSLAVVSKADATANIDEDDDDDDITEKQLSN